MSLFRCLGVALLLNHVIGDDIDCDPYLGDDFSCEQCDDLHVSTAGFAVCSNNDCLQDCYGGCVLDCAWDAYTTNPQTDQCQSTTCECHDNGCDQCVDGFWKINYDYPCQECNFPNCLHCSDFHGCQQCETGYVLYSHPTCGDESDQEDSTVFVHFCVPDTFSPEDECTFGYESPEEPPVDVDCFVCAEPCDDLTSEYGCANNDCLDTCRSCVSDCDWDDYITNGGCQNSECQCHNNGCDQCEDGWFKVDFDFPCQSCDDLIGCLQCTDYLGCQQCDDGFTMVEDDTCGEDSVVYTGGAATPVHYCVPSDGSECTTATSTGTDGTGCADIGDDCGTACDCMLDEHCDVCETWGCVTCSSGYYKMGWNYPCVSCDDNFDGCLECADWEGCTTCDGDHTLNYDADCGDDYCI